MEEDNRVGPDAEPAPLQQIGESEWIRCSTVHPRPYQDYEDETFSAMQEALIDGDLESLQDDIGTLRVGKGGVVYGGFDTEGVPRGGRYEVISYQWYLITPHGEYGRIFYTKSGDKADRLSIDDMQAEMISRAMLLGILLDVPSRVVICAYFMRFDLAALASFDSFKNRLDNVGGSLASLKRDVGFSLSGDDESDGEDSDEDADRFFRNGQRVFAVEGECYRLPVRFIDMGKHTPVGSKLSDIGGWVGILKRTIPPPYSIEAMDVYLAGDRSGFEDYALTDAEIPAKFCIALEKMVFSELLPPRSPGEGMEPKPDERILPATVSGLAIKVFKSTFASPQEFDEIFGVEDVNYMAYNRSNGRAMLRTEKALIVRREMFEAFITRAYSGGRNEAFMAGATAVEDIFDFDLASAYTSALVDLRRIDYSKLPRMTTNPPDFVGHVLGFAHARFRDPASMRFGSLPVQSKERGLYFPHEGECFCGAPEIEVALNHGVEVEILEGVIYEWAPGDDRIFEKFLVMIRQKREAAKKAGLESHQQYFKLMGNALYGKTAQGLKPKKVFEAGTEKSVELPPSAITHAAMAAHVTSFVRATMAELLLGIPDHRVVVSATTDGFLTSAPLDELKLDGPMARRYQALCDRLNPGSGMVECKHHVHQIICMRTRGQLTGEALPAVVKNLATSTDIVLAKSGESTSTNAKKIANEEMIERYLNRQPGQKSARSSFTSVREQLTKNKDVVKGSRDVSMNIEYDMKRRPVNPRMVSCRGLPVLTYDTVPWRTASDAEFARAVFDEWRRKRCLKTLDDFADWNEYYLCKLTLDKLKKRGVRVSVQVTRNGAVGILVRMFLRAFFQEAWGIQKGPSYARVAELLTEMGCPTSVNDVKNGSKGVLSENVVPRTPRSQALWDQMVLVFDGLDEGRFFFRDDSAG